MRELSAIRILKWTLKPGQSTIWRYDLSEWGGVPPVLIFDTKAARSKKLVAELFESENYYKIVAVDAQSCRDVEANQSLVTQSALAIRQGLMRVDDIVIWAKIDQYSTAASTSLTYSNGTAAFPIEEWPIIHVYPSVYGVGSSHADIIRTDSTIAFTLSSSATVGLAIFGVVGTTNQATLTIGSHTMTLGILSNDGNPSAAQIEVDIETSAACMHPAIFLSSVFGQQAATNSQALLTSAQIDTADNLTLKIDFYTDVSTCSQGSIGESPGQSAHGIMMLTASSCLLADNNWYQTDTTATDLPGRGAAGMAIFIVCIISFVLCLIGVGMYIWKRHTKLSVNSTDDDNPDYMHSDCSMTRGSSAGHTHSDTAGSGVGVTDRGRATQAIRIQPTGALRPPKFLTAG